MVFVAEASFFYRAPIFGVGTKAILYLPRCLLSVKLISVVDYIPITAVVSFVLYVDQRHVRINSQREIAFHISFDPAQSDLGTYPFAINPVARSNGCDECRQDDPIAFS